MRSKFTKREPMTPAQKKIAVCAILIALIMVVSIGYDILSPNRLVTETADTEVETTVDETEEVETVDEDEEEEESDQDVLAAGETYEFDVFSIVNATDEDLSLDFDAIEDALLNLFAEEGYDGHVDQTFSIVGTGSGTEADGTTIDSVYIYTPCDDFHYLRLSRDSGYLDYSCVSMGTSSAWLALIEFDGVDTTVAESLVNELEASADSDSDSDESTDSESEAEDDE